MRKKWLIDGHNLLHHDRQLKKQLQHQPAEAYGRLAVHVNRYTARSNRRARLVMDGNHVPVQARLDHVELRFSGNKSADEAIQKILKGGNAKNRWILVSDDHELQQFARIQGVEVQSSKSFYGSMDQQAGSTPPARRVPEKDPDVEVDDKQVKKMAQLWRLRDQFNDPDA